MSAEDENGSDSDVMPIEMMAPTMDAVPVDLSAIRARYPSVELGITIDGKYRIEKEIGRGGMGSVYRAIQLSMNRPVAIKTLKPEMLAEDLPVKRFFREAKSASQLNHPNIVRVFDFGVDESLGVPYLVMELLEGRTLTQIVAEKPLEERHAARLMNQVTKALVDAHSRGMVHRDLKPDNILVVQLPDGDEHVKVLDFGLAKVWESDGSESMVTQSGHIAGTPAFMSPEQITGESVDFRADLYALGCMLFHTLVGRPPFEGEEALSLVIKQVNDTTPSLLDAMSEIELPSHDICVLYERLMEKRPEARPQSTTAVARYFRAIARGESPNPDQLNLASEDISRKFPSQPISSTPVQTGVRSRPSGVTEARKEKRDLVYLAMGPLFLIGLGIILTQGLMSDPAAEEPRSSPQASSTVEQDDEEEAPSMQDMELPPTSKPPVTKRGAALSKEEAAALVGALANSGSEPAHRVVLIKTVPKGACLYRGDRKLGTSPLHVSHSESEAWILTIKHSNSEPKKQRIGAETPKTLTVRLED